MKTLNLIPNSDEWDAHRARSRNASELAAVMGLDKKTSRNELLRMKATGSKKEFSDYVKERIIDGGHRAEAAARPNAELIIGDDLFPVTATSDDGYISASFDGVTLGDKYIWECKSFNAILADYITRNNDLPDTHWPQVEQQLLISNAEKCLFTLADRDGTIRLQIWYVSHHERRKKIIPAWRQFDDDLAEYQHVEVAPAAVAETIGQLPALLVEIEGRVVSTNLDRFESAARELIGSIKTDLATDQDFANAEATVKYCKDAEDRLDLVKKQALAQTASIDDVFRVMDGLKEQLRATRLALDKQVKARKDAIRVQLVQEVAEKFGAHVQQLNERLGGNWMPSIKPNFGESIKGKKTITSCREALDAALANSKIEASAIADRIEINIKTLQEHVGWNDWGLVPDFAQVCVKPAEDFARLIAERKKEEQTRIAAAIAAKQAAELARQQAQAAAEQARQDAKVPAPEPEQELARELAEKAIQHEAAKPSRTANRLRTEIALRLGDLNEAQLMKVVEFVSGLIAQQKKAA